MLLRKQAVALQFVGGVDTKTDHKQVPSTKLLDLQNAIFTKRTTLSKRNGYRARSKIIEAAAGAMYKNAVGLASRGDELIVFADGRAYSHRPGADRWAQSGEVSSVVTKCEPIARTGTQQWIPDVATHNGVQAVAWEDSRNGVWLSVVEEATGRTLLVPTQLDSSTNARNPRCVNAGENLIVMWTREDQNRIWRVVVNPATPTVAPASAILIDDLSPTNPVYDAEPTFELFSASLRPAIIAWARNGGGYRVGYLHGSGVLGSPVTGLPSVATYSDTIDGPIAVAFDRFGSDRIAVAWADTAQNGKIWGRIHNGTTLASIRLAELIEESQAINKITCAFGSLDASNEPRLFWAAEVRFARTDLCRVYTGKISQSASTTDNTKTQLLGHVLLSRAFYDGPTLNATAAGANVDGHVYAAVAHAVRFFPYVGIVRLSADSGIGSPGTTFVARLLPGESAGQHFRRISSSALQRIRHVSSVDEVGRVSGNALSRKHAIPLSYRIQLDSSDGDQFAEIGIKRTLLDFDNPASFQSAELGRGLYLGGALPLHYDGNRWVEAGYHCAPDWGYDESNGTVFAPASAATVQNVGGNIAAGTYLYRVWYEDIDGQGELHVGPTSVGILVTVPADGSDQVTIAAPTYRGTNKGRVRLCAARSEAGATGANQQIPLYRITGIDPGISTGANAYLESSLTADTVNIVDQLSDADLTKREPLYTNGGILSNRASAWSGDVIASGKNRLFWTDPSDPHLVRFSQERREETALEAPPDLALAVPPDGGPIVGIAARDDDVIVFKETLIYFFAGPGPQANPLVQPEAFAFTPPRLVPSDAGCSSPSSISSTPIGTVYQSPSGVALLSLERQVLPIGQDVEGYEGQRLVRATALPGRHQVLMLTDSGRSLLYDYEHQEWSTFTNHEGFDAVIVNGVYHYLRKDGRVFVETPGIYADDNSHITMLIETAWIKLADYLQGFQKIIHAKFIGEYISAHKLKVAFRLDYGNAYYPFPDVDVNADYTPDEYGDGGYGDGAYGGDGGPTNVYQQSFHINRRCQSISFKVEDVQTAGNFGASFELSELLLTGGVIRESYPVGADRSQ